ncbi:hypothetical protein D3C76_1410060 [compost metagenome]
MASVRALPSRPRRAGIRSASQGRKGSSQIRPYLITSAIPADSSRSGKVFRLSVSMITALGW